MQQGTSIVQTVSTSTTTVNYEGQTVPAGDNRRFVNIDCHITRPAEDVDIEDFQLVKAKAALGKEENVGSNIEDDAFFWHPIDANGSLVPEIARGAADFRIRLTFKVPTSANTGYLVNQGEYFGLVSWEPTNR